MALPFDVRDLMRSGSQLLKEREEPVRLHVLVEVDAPDALLDALEKGLHPRTSTGTVRVDVVESGRVVAFDPDADAVVLVLGSGGEPLLGVLASAGRSRMPVFAVTLGTTDDAERIAVRMRLAAEDMLADPDPAEALRLLAARLTDRLPAKRLALAHNFLVMRRPVAEESVKATAWQNVIIGVVTILPGADMPLMTANQAKMLLQIAAAYGEPLGTDRIKELATVVGSGFALRAFARQVVTLVPGLGWAVKGGVAYTGTLAMGRAAIAYFEEGADLGRVVKDFGAMGERYAKGVGGRVRSLRGTKRDTELPSGQQA